MPRLRLRVRVRDRGRARVRLGSGMDLSVRLVQTQCAKKFDSGCPTNMHYHSGGNIT